MTGTDETRARKYTVLSEPRPAEILLELKKSEFSGPVARVESEDEAREFLDALRKRYHDARHVCSAFVIGADRDIQRSSDDGEPAGTAGIPMLQAVLAHRTTEEALQDLSDVCVGVVRYFGGIKLGAGGLVRAYTDATVQAIDAARLTTRERLRLGRIEVPHADAGRLENELRASDVAVLGTDYASSYASLNIAVTDSEEAREGAEAHLASSSSGQLDVTWGETEWVDR